MTLLSLMYEVCHVDTFGHCIALHWRSMILMMRRASRRTPKPSHCLGNSKLNLVSQDEICKIFPSLMLIETRACPFRREWSMEDPPPAGSPREEQVTLPFQGTCTTIILFLTSYAGQLYFSLVSTI